MAAELVYDPYDYAIDADPHPIFKRLRDEAPVYYNEQYGFWALSRFEDVLAASIDHETFSSARGTVIELMDRPMANPPMIFMDPPQHTRFRKLVRRTFTRRSTGRLEGRIRGLCRGYLDPFVGSGGFYYVAEFGARLPSALLAVLGAAALGGAFAARRRPLEGLLAGAALHHLARDGYEVPTDHLERDVVAPIEPSEQIQVLLVDIYRSDPMNMGLCERLVDLDEGIQEWRYRHVKIVERAIGAKKGTGGSLGMEFLKKSLFMPVFADLWAIRHEL